MGSPTRAVAAGLAILLASCSLAPTYERPEAPIAREWPASAGSASTSGTPAADLGWREVFGDPRLRALVGLALRRNRDLRVATLNIEVARAEHGIARSRQLPRIDASAGAVVGAGGYPGSGGSVIDSGGGTYTQYRVGAGITAFELDLFGRVRSLKEQALEAFLATEQARRSVHLALVAEVAIQFLTERALAEKLALARQTLEAVREIHDMTVQLVDAAQRSEIDVRTAEAQVEAARAEVARLTRLHEQAKNALVLLAGGPLPADLPPPAGFEDQAILADIPAGLPSDLLQRRPDILAAEHALKAANASIGAARAAFFPSISLTGFGGLASAALSGLFSGGAAFWNVAPQITAPLFAGGRNEANLDAAHARKQIEVARYEKTIQVAFREVADELVARATLEAQLEAQAGRVEAEERRFDLSTLRYRSGVASYLSVLTAQRDLYVARQQLVEVRLARLTNAVALYKALGGGWVKSTRSRDPAGSRG